MAVFQIRAFTEDQNHTSLCTVPYRISKKYAVNSGREQRPSLSLRVLLDDGAKLSVQRPPFFISYAQEDFSIFQICWTCYRPKPKKEHALSASKRLLKHELVLAAPERLNVHLEWHGPILHAKGLDVRGLRPKPSTNVLDVGNLWRSRISHTP